MEKISFNFTSLQWTPVSSKKEEVRVGKPQLLAGVLDSPASKC